MRVKSILSLAIAASMTVSGMAFAADGDKPKPDGDKPAKKPEGKPGAGGGDILKRLDKDGDGKISEKEAEGAPKLKENFGKLDTNKDGFIDAAEAKAGAPKRGEGEKKPEKKPDAPKA